MIVLLKQLGWLLAVLAIIGMGGYFSWQYSARARERIQTPRAPLPYLSSNVLVPLSDGRRLSAAIALPAGPGPFPAAVMLGVAGPNDRDLSYRGHKGFAVIADALARCKVASIRFDDPGIGGSSGNWLDISYDQLQRDAIEAAAFLRSRQGIDSQRVGFVGLSEGAGISLLAAAAHPETSFAVLMSPPGLRGDQGLREQFERLLSWSPFLPAATVDQHRRAFEQFIGLTRAAHDARGRQQLARFLGGEGRALVPSYGFVPVTLDGRVRLFSSPWYRSQLDYDPTDALKSVSSRILVISGARDQVLPPQSHLPPLRRGLAGKKVTFTMVPGANHLLMPSWTGLPLEYSHLETTVDPKVLSALCEWINTG